MLTMIKVNKLLHGVFIVILYFIDSDCTDVKAIIRLWYFKHGSLDSTY